MEIHRFVNSFVNETYASRLAGVYINAKVKSNGDDATGHAPIAVYIFLKILAPGLSEETPSDAKTELASQVSCHQCYMKCPQKSKGSISEMYSQERWARNDIKLFFGY